MTDPVYTCDIAGFGRLDISAVDPVADGATLHRWFTARGAEFWGMQSSSEAEVVALYESLPELVGEQRAWLIRRDGVPTALLQTLVPDEDVVGGDHGRLPGDVGMHFLFGTRGSPAPGLTSLLLNGALGFLFEDPAVERIVVDPDVRNDRAIRRAVKTGFELGPVVDVPGKRLQLGYLTRARWVEHTETPAGTPVVSTTFRSHTEEEGGARGLRCPCGRSHRRAVLTPRQRDLRILRKYAAAGRLCDLWTSGTGDLFPDRWAARGAWTDAFRELGFTHDGAAAQRPSGQLHLYRGSPYPDGLAWTESPVMAAIWALAPRYIPGSNYDLGSVWQATVAGSDVLATFDYANPRYGSWTEYVIDTKAAMIEPIDRAEYDEIEPDAIAYLSETAPAAGEPPILKV